MSDGPDLVYTVPTEELVGVSLTENPRKTHRVREQFTYPDVYGGFSELLFRTAVVRSTDWRPSDKGPVMNLDRVIEVCSHLRWLDHERLVSLVLDEKRRLLAIHEAGVGGLHGTSTTPADMTRVPALLGAHGVIIVHNHPSGDPTFSHSDLEMTDAVGRALELIGIELVDHVVLAGRSWLAALSGESREAYSEGAGVGYKPFGWRR